MTGGSTEKAEIGNLDVFLTALAHWGAAGGKAALSLHQLDLRPETSRCGGGSGGEVQISVHGRQPLAERLRRAINQGNRLHPEP